MGWRQHTVEAQPFFGQAYRMPLLQSSTLGLICILQRNILCSETKKRQNRRHSSSEDFFLGAIGDTIASADNSSSKHQCIHTIL